LADPCLGRLAGVDAGHLSVGVEVEGVSEVDNRNWLASKVLGPSRGSY
jgi:hypothetical protein